MGRSCFVCRIREGFEGQIPVECRDLAFLLLDERYLEKRRREDEENHGFDCRGAGSSIRGGRI